MVGNELWDTGSASMDTTEHSSDIPMLSAVNRNNETRSSNYMLVNGAYFKLRNATLAYTLPRASLRRYVLVCYVFM